MKKLILISVVIFSVKIVTGTINEYAGNSSAQFLKIVSGTRSAGMANSVTSVGGTVESVFYNPAGIAGIGCIDNIELNVNYARLFEGVNYISIVEGMAMPKIGSIAVGFAGLLYGDFPVMAQNRSGELKISEGSIGASGFLFQFSYSREIKEIPSVSIGCSAKMVIMTLGEESGTGIGFDIGMLSILMERRLGLGIAFQNIIATRLTVMEKGYSQPSAIKIGSSYKILDINYHTGLIAVDAVKESDDNFKINTGFEYGFKDSLYIRIGYQIGNDLTGLTSGAGANLITKNRHIRIDYAFLPYAKLGTSHRFGLTIGL